MATYDPYNREEEMEADRLRHAREAHERWSREQSLQGRSALARDNENTWVPRHVWAPEDQA